MLRRWCSIASGPPKPLSVTCAPSAAKARATARPIPDVEPVTTTDFPRIIRPSSFLHASAYRTEYSSVIVGCYRLRHGHGCRPHDAITTHSLPSGHYHHISPSGQSEMLWVRAKMVVNQ